MYREKIIKQSNYWYNDGLKRANFKDLSGAIVSLRRSLQFNNKNIPARNLLGLVYYGRGEINAALVEWIISKNLKPRDNIANYFIRKVQNSPKELNRMNASIRKYNQCLEYCHNDAEDLAFIQIKEVVAMHPSFVKGYQLLALLSIRKEQYKRASTVLKKAQKIDTTDAVTLYYMSEITEIKEQGKRSVEDEERSISYKDGNETIIQPTSVTLKEDAGQVAIINIIIGIVIGLAVMGFLVVPALNKAETSKNADAIRDYNEQVSALDAEINALKTELETYRTTNDEAELAITNSETIQENYEILSEVQIMYDQGSSSDSSMAEILKTVDSSLLGDVGLEWYDGLVDLIFEPICESLYSEALEVYNVVSITAYADGTPIEYEASEYEPMVEPLAEIMEMIPDYSDYKAAYMLAMAYMGTEEWENAEIYYNIIVDESDNSTYIAAAKEALEEIEEKLVDVEE